jgi:hypothetical protein
MPAALAPEAPELALLPEELRAVAIAMESELPWRIYTPLAPLPAVAAQPLPPELVPPEPERQQKQKPVVLSALLYAGWQVLLGAVFGVGVVVAMGVGLLVLSLIP